MTIFSHSAMHFAVTARVADSDFPKYLFVPPFSDNRIALSAPGFFSDIISSLKFDVSRKEKVKHCEHERVEGYRVSENKKYLIGEIVFHIDR